MFSSNVITFNDVEPRLIVFQNNQLIVCMLYCNLEYVLTVIAPRAFKQSDKIIPGLLQCPIKQTPVAAAVPSHTFNMLLQRVLPKTTRRKDNFLSL